TVGPYYFAGSPHATAGNPAEMEAEGEKRDTSFPRLEAPAQTVTGLWVSAGSPTPFLALWSPRASGQAGRAGDQDAWVLQTSVCSPACTSGGLCFLPEPGAQNVQVQVPAEVRGLLGNDVQLPCRLVSGEAKIQVSQVMWLRWDRYGGSQSVAVFHPQHGASFPNSGPHGQRMAFVSGNSRKTEAELEDATLLLRGLRADDEANYTCEFATFPWGSSKGATWLRVLAEPQNHAEPQEVTLGPGPMPMARCVSSGGRPAARISWFSPLAGKGTETRTAGPEPGTFTVTSRFISVPTPQADGAKVTCKVEHEALSEPVLLPLTLSVR
ncbi:nectin-2-like, partial [Gracilinanus agilis]|uniref:nectin-2-like n=1 Tax=Gracilinanus agilis TaxID=191870 RepID=UPI001CFD2BEA